MASTPLNPVGDGVRFEDDERLDIPDTRALQTLIYEYVADAIGGLVGETSGALTNIVFDTADVTRIGIGECTLCGFRRRSGSSARVRGGIFAYDPASNIQAGMTSVNLSAYVAGEDNAYLWFRRVELAANLATRHKFDSTADKEKTFSLNTRLRTKIAFGASISRTIMPDANTDWFVFAQVVSWAGSVPTIRPIHPLDVGIDPASYSDGFRIFVGDQLTASLEAYTVGLAQHVTFLGNRISNLQDSANTYSIGGAVATTGTDGLFTDVARGAKQLDADLTAASASIAVVSTDVGKLKDVIQIASFIFIWTGSTYSMSWSEIIDGLSFAVGPTTTLQDGTHRVDFTLDTSSETAQQLGWHGSADDNNTDMPVTDAPVIVMTKITSANGPRTLIGYSLSCRQGDGTRVDNSFSWTLFGSRNAP